MKSIPFSRSAVLLLIAAGVALFALSILLHAYDDTPSRHGEHSGYGSYSVSAIGCAGFYDLLRRLDRPVSRSSGNTLYQVGSEGTLILAEPEMRFIDNVDGLKAIYAPRLLLVLPKWRGVKDDGRPAWVSSVAPVSLGQAQQILGLVVSQGSVLRVEWPGTPTSSESAASPASPLSWTHNELGVTPTGTGVVQLVRSARIRPIVGTDDAMLLGEVIGGDTRIWVLSDPDVMANHGLGKGGNAAFMLALVDALRSSKKGGPAGAVVFDETVHGYRQAQGSPVQLLFRFPVVVFTLLLCAAAILLLSGARRFGAPREARPALDFGKKQLIDNSARLLDYAGHHAAIVIRYIRMMLHSTARALHAPPGLDGAQLAAWLDRIGEARGVSKSCSSLLRETAELDVSDPKKLPRLFAIAWDIYRWKGEILHGASQRQHRG